MIELDYELDPNFAREMEGRDLTAATSTDLEFRLFCSNLFFRVDIAEWAEMDDVG